MLIGIGGGRGAGDSVLPAGFTGSPAISSQGTGTILAQCGQANSNPRPFKSTTITRLHSGQPNLMSFILQLAHGVFLRETTTIRSTGIQSEFPKFARLALPSFPNSPG